MDLLRSRRFLPLMVVQSLGAFNDNVFRNAFAILVTFRLLQEDGGSQAGILVPLATALFMLPYFFFSALAGQMADKYQKPMLIQRLKLAEIGIMALGGVAMVAGSVPGMLFTLFLTGTQSSFFGPLKYGLLPQHLEQRELLAGNGLIDAGSFLSILLGTIAGGVMAAHEGGAWAVAATMLGLSILAWWVSLHIPHAPSLAPDLPLRRNVFASTVDTVRQAAAMPTIFPAVLGIGWFWFVGSLYLGQFPSYVKHSLGGGQELVTLFLVLFSCGVATGSLLCNRILKGRIEAHLVPFAALGMTVFSFDLSLASGAVFVREQGQELLTLSAFVTQMAGWRIMADLTLIAACGGLYSVPLYALIQHRSPPDRISRIISADNIISAALMTLSSLLAIAVTSMGGSIKSLFALVAFLSLFVSVAVCVLVPQGIVKSALRALLRAAYDVRVVGAENIVAAGDKAVIVSNHVSWLDGVLLAVFLPGRPCFAIHSNVANWWCMKFITPLVRLVPIDPMHPLSAKSLIHLVAEGAHLVIFPEGRITTTGTLMKVNEGPAMIADKANAPIVPVRIEGAQYSTFSMLGRKMRLRRFPRIRITIGAPVRLAVPEGGKSSVRRQKAACQLYDLMCQLMVQTRPHPPSLFEAILDARAMHGGGHIILEDPQRRPMSYDRLLLGAMALGRRLQHESLRGEVVGVLLPNAVGTAVTVTALQAIGRVPAMLNVGAAAKIQVACCRTAGVRLVLTSRRFIEAARLDKSVEALSAQCRLIYIEDLVSQIDLGQRLTAWALRFFARRWHRGYGLRENDAAVVMFTSGSEGSPKGVALSHGNLLSNRYQLAACIDFHPGDIVFNALPIFHAFGLTVGLLLPLLAGTRTFLYPSPLHYRIVPKLSYDSNATILFGTDTFLSGYARMAHPYDFYSLRYVFAGAERLREETRRQWSDKFGVRIFEGYGATETAPVLSLNTCLFNRSLGVGRFLPGVEWRLETVPWIAEGGRLFVRGPNVMLGYLRAEAPGVLQPLADGWYDTGDIVTVDESGFVTILGRVKRFAKIGGEMVSLAAVEEAAGHLWPVSKHAVVNLPDPRKGEHLVLYTDRIGATRQELQQAAPSLGLSELALPRRVVVLPSLPVLPSGKMDYVTLTEFASRTEEEGKQDS
ncbi:MAG: acyl-[ACP]--phospholipid O-acyltransferase [Alphaproteobacteria bacterium]|nr:MAG: acyl-[ACP]--phospholipid O-acyltransferase [Alphaproteobacteria bacterium]